MNDKLNALREIAEKRGDFIGPLLPARWIELKGNFTSIELKEIYTIVEDNFKRFK